MNIQVINADVVRRRLTMHACIDLMETTQTAISQGEIHLPPRSFLPVGDGAGLFGVMPGEVRESGLFGAKLIGLYPGNPAKGRAAIQGYVILFDSASGAPKALVEASSITAIRTAAASAAATRRLARTDARVLALLGYGVQAESHLEAMCCVREIQEVRVWGPSLDKSRAFAARYGREGLAMIAARSPTEAVRGAEIICAVSNASDPLILAPDVGAGTHLNLVGAHRPRNREVDGETVARSRVYTEITEFALAEAGDLMLAIEEGAFCEQDIVGEIGEVFAGTVPGRTSETDITLYENLGNTAQDLAAALFVAERSPELSD